MGVGCRITAVKVCSLFPRLSITVAVLILTPLLAVRSEPGIAYTAFRHVTTRPVRHVFVMILEIGIPVVPLHRLDPPYYYYYNHFTTLCTRYAGESVPEG